MSEQPNTISEARKKQLISFTLLFFKKLESFKKGEIIKAIAGTEQEQEFLNEVCEEIEKTVKEGYLTVAEQYQLQATLFEKFGISQQETKIIKENLREDLYEEGSIKKDVKLKNLSPENRIAYPTYCFGNKEYTITMTGTLQYVTAQDITEQISQYEIIIDEGEKTYITRAFGTIIFNMIDQEAYRNGMFLGLLNERRLKDPAMHGYIGALVPKKDEEGKTQYIVQYRPEEYTAVIELERERGKKRNNVISINGIGDAKQKEAGGEAR